MKIADLIESARQLRWAVGQNADKAYGYISGFLKETNTVVIWAHIGDLFSKTDRDFRLDPEHSTGGDGAIEGRVERAKQYWADGGYMNPSDILVDEQGVVQWGDGRHRMVAAHQLGQKYGPVVMEREYLENFVKSGIRYRGELQ